ncbi:MAG TPA: 5-(carboxyamino)imidazole ribonucleotide synthase [Chthoniobacterales bacterium]|jgi:5-(carboxyamino)imidazole ribonucleotide synthase|nr:5-(carboxyamino)imidazole ribonucleotide synthase [Chthoniobacterales bacterium]
MTRPYLPGATIGLMGSGQLGRMFAIAARRMGYRIQVYSPEKDTPAGQFADREVTGAYEDESAVRAFAKNLNLLTFEFENIPRQTIEWCGAECEVRPAGSILHTAQNRLREKDFLSAASIPVAPYRGVRSPADLASAFEEIQMPAILKSAAFGYDGKGQRFIDQAHRLNEIWADRPGDELILERAVDFEKEVSVIVARGPTGEIATFPVCENMHRDHILDITVVPARVSDAVEKSAADLARAIAEKMALVGLLAVEMFLQRDGTLLVNELAPRPHNSGHWTIEGCATSQFEQHVRAICGLPLGATNIVRPSAMANLLGDVWSDGEPNWAAALGVKGVRLHLYGKHQPRPRRKMGHLTGLADSPEAAIDAVSSARAALQGRAA